MFATVEEALDDLSRGSFVIVVDSRDPGSEGDRLIAAEGCTAESSGAMKAERAAAVGVQALSTLGIDFERVAVTDPQTASVLERER